MSTAAAISAAMAIYLTLLMAAVPRASPSPVPDMANCGGRLLLLWPCVAFAEGVAPDPSDACCDSLVNLYRSEPRCLCPLLDRALASLPVNRSLALQLPRLCRLNLTSEAEDDTCSALSPLAPPPTHAASEGSSANSSSGAAASPPPWRMNNVLLGINQGRRFEVGEASTLALAAAAAVVLLLEETFG